MRCYEEALQGRLQGLRRVVGGRLHQRDAARAGAATRRCRRCNGPRRRGRRAAVDAGPGEAEARDITLQYTLLYNI